MTETTVNLIDKLKNHFPTKDRVTALETKVTKLEEITTSLPEFELLTPRVVRGGELKIRCRKPDGSLTPKDTNIGLKINGLLKTLTTDDDGIIKLKIGLNDGFYDVVAGATYDDDTYTAVLSFNVTHCFEILTPTISSGNSLKFKCYTPNGDLAVNRVIHTTIKKTGARTETDFTTNSNGEFTTPGISWVAGEYTAILKMNENSLEYIDEFTFKIV